MKNQALTSEFLEDIKINEFLEDIKIKNQLTSNYQLGKFMEENYDKRWTRQFVSLLMTNQRPCPEARALDIADALELDPAYVLAALKAGRESDPRVKKAWEHAAKIAQSVSMAVVVFLMVSIPYPTYATELGAKTCDAVYYVKSYIWRYIESFHGINRHKVNSCGSDTLFLA